ncbi:MAG: hypothetical protein AVDCRST_MAG78-2827, partial [uncultured Rubrobacteraceae bacterium]
GEPVLRRPVQGRRRGRRRRRRRERPEPVHGHGGLRAAGRLGYGGRRDRGDGLRRGERRPQV